MTKGATKHGGSKPWYNGKPMGRSVPRMLMIGCSVAFTDVQMDQIDAYARKNNVSFSQAVRELVEAGVANADTLPTSRSNTCAS